MNIRTPITVALARRAFVTVNALANQDFMNQLGLGAK